MNTKDRIHTIRLLNRIHSNKVFCSGVGIYDTSTFQGKRIEKYGIPLKTASTILRKGERT